MLIGLSSIFQKRYLKDRTKKLRDNNIRDNNIDAAQPR